MVSEPLASKQPRETRVPLNPAEAGSKFEDEETRRDLTRLRVTDGMQRDLMIVGYLNVPIAIDC